MNCTLYRSYGRAVSKEDGEYGQEVHTRGAVIGTMTTPLWGVVGVIQFEMEDLESTLMVSSLKIDSVVNTCRRLPTRAYVTFGKRDCRLELPHYVMY